MKKKSIEIILPQDKETLVKRVSRAVLGNTPPTKAIVLKKDKPSKHKKQEEQNWTEA